jgi:hypothetical protein
MQTIPRRSFVKFASAAGLGLTASRGFSFAPKHNDDALLEDLSHRCFNYFADSMNPTTGICWDLIHGNPADSEKKQDDQRGSTGVTGFALTAMAIGAERKYIDRAKAKDNVRRCLRSYTNGTAKGSNGWFWHFNDVRDGERWKEVEISTSDCIWLLAGALTCRQYFHEDKEIVDLATLLYSRMDFQWMTNGDGKLLSHGWKPPVAGTPGDGHLPLRYDKYCQLAAMYLLGIGAPFHPLPPEAWYAWERNPNTYASYNYIGTSLLWTYQYPFAWFDFRGRRENRGTKIDWFDNCVTATKAHREWCYTDMGKLFPQSYTPDVWGITSSSSPKGYKAWGGPPKHSQPDGSVIPCAAGGSLMIAPDICLPALHAMKDKFGDKAWGKYGLVDAFNPTTAWVSTDTLGLDVGMTLLSIENFRTGNLWSWFMANPEPQKAMKLAGLDKV